MSFHHIGNQPTTAFLDIIAAHAQQMKDDGHSLADALAEIERECGRANCEFDPEGERVTEEAYVGTWKSQEELDAIAEAEAEEEGTDADADADVDASGTRTTKRAAGAK